MRVGSSRGMDDDLVALVRGVIQDLDGAGALADALQERGRDREAMLLRRRWRMWTKILTQMRLGEKTGAQFSCFMASELFRKYIRKRFKLPPRRKAARPTSHTCYISNTCECSADALEPAANCPIHGFGSWPPRCASCGRLMPHSMGGC